LSDSDLHQISALVNLGFGRITQEMYDKKLKEYKEKQEDLLLQMEEHSKADKNFYITAATVLDLSSRALEIFKSSEVTSSPPARGGAFWQFR